MTNREVKRILRTLGAELCGVAGLDRFAGAPEGYHPLDVWPECRSVISFACRFPAAAACGNDVVYTRVRNSITAKLDAIALDFCIETEKQGVACIPIPTNESQWDGKTGRWRSIVSQKHAAQAAELEADPLLEPVCDGCGKCVKVCPAHALDGEELVQQACWDHAFGDDPEKQVWCIACHACRDVCPYCFGNENGGGGHWV